MLISIALQLGGGDEAQRLLTLVGLENAPETKIHERQADVHQAVRHRSPACLRLSWTGGQVTTARTLTEVVGR